jgi:magnesium transporter
MDSEEEAAAILDLMDDPEEAAEIKHLLSYEEGTAGALMTSDVFEVSRDLTVGRVLERLRNEQPDPSTLHYLYMTDDDEKLVGVVSLGEIAVAQPETVVRDLMHENLISVEGEIEADECARLIAKYDLLALPVVDLNGALLGAVTVDDVLDIIAHDDWKNQMPRVFAKPMSRSS